MCDELGAVIRADEGWDTAQDEQIAERIDHASGVEPAFDLDRQAFSAELVEDVQRPEGSAVIGPTMNEVIAPDMVRMLGS